jgi:CBS domain containing-hemolysin-like protein
MASIVDILWGGFLMLFLLLLKGFFSGSEIAMVNADKLKLRHKSRQGDKGAKLVIEQLNQPHVLLGTTLVGTNISTVTLTSLGTIWMIDHFGAKGDLLSFLLFTPFLLIFGEIVPKSVYQQLSDQLVTIIIYPLRFASMLLYPIVFIFSKVARMATFLVGDKGSSKDMYITREQLRSIVDMAERGSHVDAFDRGRIRRAIRFADTPVGEVMIPVAEIVALNRNMSTSDAISMIRRHGYNRLPVYQGNISNVIGVLTITTWDLMDKTLSDLHIKKLMQPAHYVSPLQTVDELLPILRERDDHMSIVVDEFGSAIGLITLEDILEEVVGEIDVGYDFEEYLPKRRRIFEMLDKDTYIIDSRVPISETNDVLNIQLPTHEAHTIGGLVLSRIRHIPKEGENIVMHGWCFTVEKASERAIIKLRVEPEIKTTH